MPSTATEHPQSYYRKSIENTADLKTFWVGLRHFLGMVSHSERDVIVEDIERERMLALFGSDVDVAIQDLGRRMGFKEWA